MRTWTSQRADADLRITPPPVPIPSAPEPDPLPDQALPPMEIAQARPEMPRIEEGEPTFTTAEENREQAISESNPFLKLDLLNSPNFYDVLQISPRADLETIHRVYRILAARFHPDNPVSGDHERFLKLCEAYEVLSKPERRFQYDQALQIADKQPRPIFGRPAFTDDLEGELNRRYGVLALLYRRRRIHECSPGISTLDLEHTMALPREHLEFTLWYLRNKQYVQVLEDNSDYAITAIGVDHVESQMGKCEILQQLLTTGQPASKPADPSPTPAKDTGSRVGWRQAKSQKRRARKQASRELQTR
jgi:hypothetical protein